MTDHDPEVNRTLGTKTTAYLHVGLQKFVAEHPSHCDLHVDVKACR